MSFPVIPPEKWELAKSLYIQRVKCPEIAQRCGFSIAALYKQIHRGNWAAEKLPKPPKPPRKYRKSIPLPPDALFNTASLETTQKCNKCDLEKPIFEFYHNRISGRRFVRCKECCRSAVRSYHKINPHYKKEWRANNPAYQNEWYRARQIARGAQTLQEYNAKQIFNSHRSQRIRARASLFRELYGSVVSDRYLAVMNSGRQPTGQNTIKRIKDDLLPTHLKVLGWAACHRIEHLNIAAGQVFGTIGWKCSKCGIYDEDHRFFDIDHVKARYLGGHNGHNNKQILCPNCHRRKTIEDTRDAGKKPQELGVDASVQDVTTSYTNNTSTRDSQPAVWHPAMDAAKDAVDKKLSHRHDRHGGNTGIALVGFTG